MSWAGPWGGRQLAAESSGSSGVRGWSRRAAGAAGERRVPAECVSRMGTLTYFGWADCVDDWRCCDAQLPCHAGWVDTGGLGTARSGRSPPEPDNGHSGEVVGCWPARHMDRITLLCRRRLVPCRVIRHSDVMWQNCRQKTKLGISVARYQMDWWGHNEKHGWVVLDRNIPCNQPGSRGDLLFFRFRDSTTFPVARGDWHEPQYMYAPNYLRGKPSEVVEEFESLQSGWPELKVEMQRQRQTAENEKRMAALEKIKEQAIAKHRLLLAGR